MACSAGPDELVLAFVALDERGVDRGGEGWVVELEREVFGARLAGGPAPAGSELDTGCDDPEVRGTVVVSVAGLDAGLNMKSEGLDGAVVGAGFVAGEGAESEPLSNLLRVGRSRPMRPRWRSRGDGLACCIRRTTA